MTRHLAALGLLLALTACATGYGYTPPTPAPPLSPTPQWVLDANRDAPVKLVRNFTNRDMERYYPAAALRAAIEGNTLIMCDWDDAGRITTCRVLEETPLGQGFGAAAVAMVQAKVELAASDGNPLRAGTNKPFIVRWKVA